MFMNAFPSQLEREHTVADDGFPESRPERRRYFLNPAVWNIIFLQTPPADLNSPPTHIKLIRRCGSKLLRDSFSLAVVPVMGFFTSIMILLGGSPLVENVSAGDSRWRMRMIAMLSGAWVAGQDNNIIISTEGARFQAGQINAPEL
jgi:hypothetical protein